MKASVVDLRYKMKNVLQAIDRNETVTILHHGQERAIITPIDNNENKSVVSHPFFGMKNEAVETVDETMERLRGGRY